MPTLKTINKRKPKSNWSKHDNFYNRSSWRSLRNKKLRKDPLCEVCKKEGKIKTASIVDHHKPKRLWPELALTPSNLTSMCESHHNKKSRIELDIHSQYEWHAVFDNHKLFNKLLKP